MLDRTNPRSTTDARARAAEIADKYIPAADGAVATTDNQPPGSIDSAKEATKAISAWLQDIPVVETLEQARACATQMRLGKTALDELEIERTGTDYYKSWRLFDAKVKVANKIYKAVADPLSKLVFECDKRLYRYRQAEKERKRQEAAEAQRRAEEARQRAEEAAFARDEALNDAEVGVSEDVGERIVIADQLEKRAAISTQIADGLMRNAETVRVRDEFGGRAVADRNPDVPTLTDAIAAITAIGITEKIEQAIISSARDFYRAHQEWPAGITLVKQRDLEQ